MKKLALASVALAGVSVFGAGDAFSAPNYFAISTNGSNYPADAYLFKEGVSWASQLGHTSSSVSNGLGKSGSAALVNSTVYGNAQVGVSTSIPGGYAEITGVRVGYGGVKAALPTGTYGLLVGGTASSHPASTFSFTVSIMTNPGYTQNRVIGAGFDLSPLLGCPSASKLGASCASATRYDVTINAFTGTSMSLTPIVVGGTTTVHFNDLSTKLTEFIGIGATTGGHVALRAPDITQISVMVQAYSTDSSVNVNYYGIVVGPVSLEAVPEPASMSVVGIGLLGLAAVSRRRRSASPNGARWSPFGRWRVAEDPPDPTTS